MGERLTQPQLHRFVRQQAQRPPLPPVRRVAAGHGDHVRLAFGIKLTELARPWPLGQGREILFHKPLAGAFDRGHAGADLLGNLFIAQPFIRLEQNPRPREFAGRSLSAAGQAEQFVAFGRC